MADSKALGKMIDKILKSRDITKEDFASQIGASKNKLDEWLSGSKLPNREYIQRILKVLKLDHPQEDELLSYTGLNNSRSNGGDDPKNVFFVDFDRILGNTLRPSGFVINESKENISSSDTYKKEIQKLKNQISKLNSLVEGMKSKSPDKPDEDQDGESAIQKLGEVLGNMKVPTQPITAPVILPSPEDIEVRLVSSTSLERLEEYRSEEANWTTITGTILGAIMGFIINVLTGSKMSTEGWILLMVFLILAIISRGSYKRYQNRANKVRQQIFKTKPISSENN